jgi:hypothetical protein
MKEKKSKLNMGRRETRGKGEGVANFRVVLGGKAIRHNDLANPWDLITKHIFALFRVLISTLEYKCTKFSTCVIDLRVLMFGDK